MRRTQSHSRPRPKEVIIAVMGMTGVGKSSFIQRVTQSKDIRINHSLAPGIYSTRPSLRLSSPSQYNHFPSCLKASIRDICPLFSIHPSSASPWPVFHTSLDSVFKERRYPSDLFSNCRTGTHDVKPYTVSIHTPRTSSHEAQTFAITLIDCPGFDDPSATDAETITAILTYLNTTYHQGKKLHGIIYMLNITNKRIRGIDRRNIAMFQRLCGVGFYPNVVLGTTHWDKLKNVSEGEDREKELMTNPQFWGDFANKGSKLRRIGINETGHNGDIDIVLEIARNHHPRVLHAQEEMNSGLTPSETSAAREVDVWNFFFEEQRRMFDELRQRRLSYREQIAQNRTQLEREFEEFEANLSKEDEELALQLARGKEEIEFQRNRLARRLNGEQDLANDNFRHSQRLEHQRKVQQLEEELANKRLALQERIREEHEQNVKKCKRQTTTKLLVCGGPRSGGCRRTIYVNRERFYRKSYKTSSVIDLV